MQEDLPYEVNTVTLESFQKKGHPKPLLRGTVQKCERVDKKQKGHVMKIVPKGAENDKAIKAELDAYAVICHPNLAALKYYFTDEQNHYLVYSRFGGKNLKKRIHKIGVLQPEWVQILGLQFLSVLDALHKENLYYLRQGIDNIWVDNNLRLTIVGLDYSGLEAGSPYLAKDATPSAGSDWFSLGYFIHYCLTDNPPAFPLNADLSDEAKALLTTCLQGSQADRNSLKPRLTPFLLPPMEVEADGTHFKVNDFELNWEEGFVVTLGGLSLGWKGGLYFKFGPVFEKPEVPSEDEFNWPATRRWFGWPDRFWGEPLDESIEVTLNADGLTINDGSSQTTMNIGPNGIEAKNDIDLLRAEFNGEGIKMSSWLGGVKISADGAFVLNMGSNHLIIDDSGPPQVGFDPGEMQQGMEDGGTVFVVGISFYLYIGSKGLKSRLGPTSLVVNDESTSLSCGPMCIKVLYSGALVIKLGGFHLRFDKDGCTITAGTLVWKINSSGMDIEVDGFHITVGGDGVKVETEYEFNWGQYLSNIPAISINLNMPTLPGAPKMPSIDIGLGGLSDLFSCCRVY